MTARAEDSPTRIEAARPWVRAWLIGVAGLVLLMVVVGGATRLTGSGLSITEWALVTGAVPPLSESAWMAEFERYREIPQYQLVNRGMSLAEFKSIYWWEWGHRFLGRLVGFAFLVPFLWFWLTGRLERRLVPWLLGAFALGGLQGVIGWYMVASGLTERVTVSQYRLAVHLTLAAVILAYLLWLAEGLRPSPGRRDRIPSRVSSVATGLPILVLVQIALGAFVAGLHAGPAFPTWPLMGGSFVPQGLLALDPWWANAFENVATVQFNHRLMGYLLVALALFHAVDCARTLGEGPQAARAGLLALLMLVQAGIGVATLLLYTPLELALAHQAVAMLVLAVSVVHLVRLPQAGQSNGLRHALISTE